jgi:hypothetical protein
MLLGEMTFALTRVAGSTAHTASTPTATLDFLRMLRDVVGMTGVALGVGTERR